MDNKWTDSSVARFVKFLGQLLALNVLCFLCSLPIITIVASFSAMYSVLFRLRRDSMLPVIRTFFVSFKENFLPSVALEIVVFLLGVLAYGDATYALSQSGTVQFLFLAVATVVSLVALIILTYGTSQIANFNNTVKNYGLNVSKLGEKARNAFYVKDDLAADVIVVAFDFRKQALDLQYETLSFINSVIRNYADFAESL